MEQIKTTKGAKTVITKHFVERRDITARGYTLSYENKVQRRNKSRRAKRRSAEASGGDRQGILSPRPRPDNNFS